MACVIVPAMEAIITTTLTKELEKKEIKFSHKMKGLNSMLWGGSALLALEHVWHGEIVPWFPFLTKAKTAKDTAEMLAEMSTVGVSMAVLVTTVWALMVGVSHVLERKAKNEEVVKEEGQG